MEVTPNRYARALCLELSLPKPMRSPGDAQGESSLWATSGGQYLTGESDGPTYAAPAPLATTARGVWLVLAQLSDGALDPEFPAHQLLGERAAIFGLKRQGAVSPGGSCRLFDCLDGQLALNLARDEDWSLLPAWLECRTDSWESIARALRDRHCEPMVARARLLGLAAAGSKPPTGGERWFKTVRLAPALKHTRPAPLVVDLTALWAGPLCTQLLGDMGARVIKVESTSRPDGARSGPLQFFNLLNCHKQSVALNVREARGRQQLFQLLQRADIVIESNRPRALEQMGIRAADIVRQGKGCVWLSITGYGRDAPMGDWVAFGDDAGVAAGLSWLLHQSSGTNTFCSDAIADPLAGLHAALVAWSAWTQGGGVLLDLSLDGVLAHCIAAGHGDDRTLAKSAVLPPTARSPQTEAITLGGNTAEVLSEFGIKT